MTKTDRQPITSLSIDLDQIALPAFFVAGDLSVSCTASSNTETFCQTLAKELKSSSAPNIFDLLLRPTIKDTLCDWQTLFSFVYTMLQQSTEKDTFSMGTVFVPKMYIPVFENEYFDLPKSSHFHVESCTLDSDPPMGIYGLQFKEGTLFVLHNNPLHCQFSKGIQLQSITDTMEASDVKKTFCVLSVRINDSHKISDAMLPDVFMEVINHVWSAADNAVRPFGGVRIGCIGPKVQYLFAESIGRNPIFSAICCATQLNDLMRTIEKKIKEKLGWMDVLRLNMGISHGTDDPAAPDIAETPEFMIPGGAPDQSSFLSDASAKGEIWITKNAVTQLPKKLMDRIVLGVDRDGRFLRNFFTQLSDPFKESAHKKMNHDFTTLFVARIIKVVENLPPTAKKN